MALLHDPNLWLYILVGFFVVSLIVPVVSVVRSRKLAGGPEADSDASLPIGEILDNPRELLPHLVALRQRLTRAFIALIVCIAVSFIFSKQILTVVSEPIGGLDQLQAIEVTEPISVFMRTAMITGFVLALPYIFAQLWLFIAPGLQKNEFRYIYVILPFALILFLGGASLAYFVLLPVAIPILVNFMDIETTPRPANYIAFVASLTFWVGLSFESPLVALILARLGLITPRSLARHWRYVLVIIAIVAAMVTPTVDPLNMSLVMGLLLFLYLLSIVLAWLAYRPRARGSGSPGSQP